MKSITKIFGWIFVLILVYLLVRHGPVVNSLIKELGSTSLKGIAVLQGRTAREAVA